MTTLTKSTIKMLCVRSTLTRQEITEEAQKLFDLCKDPKVPAEEKEKAKRELDLLIKKLETKVETNRHLKNGNTP